MAAQTTSLTAKLNWLRAGVLGANDGIVSIAGIVMGVAGATANSSALLIAGLAGLVAGALSMAGGEYVSVSSQKDTEIAAVSSVKALLASDPDNARRELAEIYTSQGLSARLASEVAEEYSHHDGVAALTSAKFGISAHEQTSPWIAALASLISFTVGASIPLVAMVASPADFRIWGTCAAVMVALILTGSISATLGHANVIKAVVRNCVVGAATMGLTYLVGHLVTVQI